MNIKNKIQGFINKRYYALIHYRGERRKIIDYSLKLKKTNDMKLLINEAYQIYMVTKATEKIEGDIAEVGVYMGGSAKMICKAKGDKTLYLFDTFEGLPEVMEIDKKATYYKGRYSASYEFVKESFNDEKNVKIYKGFFPDTAGPIKDKKFSYVNLDVDIYESTLNCLKYFYPRMSKGGVITSHDYITDGEDGGVKKAFDEFFRNKSEPIILMSGSQCLVVKC